MIKGIDRKKILIQSWVYLRYKSAIDTILAAYGVSSEKIANGFSSIIGFSVYDPSSDRRYGIGPLGIQEITEKLAHFNIEMATEPFPLSIETNPSAPIMAFR
jgi:hypothetical protein